MKKLHHDEEIIGLNQTTIGDFWSWAYSDVLMNTVRSVFAEFLIASALGLTDTPRLEWDAVDLHYQSKTIEVKASAYLQSWSGDRLSKIQFDIAKRSVIWEATTGKSTNLSEPGRPSDCYVFCLYKEIDAQKSNVLDVSKWSFYVIATEQINRAFGDQKAIGLKRLESMSKKVGYNLIRTEIGKVLGL